MMFYKTCLILAIQNMSRNAYAQSPPPSWHIWKCLDETLACNLPVSDQPACLVQMQKGEGDLKLWDEILNSDRIFWARITKVGEVSTGGLRIDILSTQVFL